MVRPVTSPLRIVSRGLSLTGELLRTTFQTQETKLTNATPPTILFIINDGPYGNERTYNALRLAMNLVKRAEAATIRVFLTGDGVACAKWGQKTPDGFYNVERMLKSLTRRGELAV